MPSPIKRFAPTPLQENIPSNGTDQKIDALIELVKKQQEQHLQTQHQIKVLADQIANQTVLIRQLLTERSNSEEIENIFPLEKEEDMLRLEDEIRPETRNKYVTAMKKILAPVGIKKGLSRIVSADIMDKYNIHGVKQKKGFKSLPKFYRALLDSVPDSASGDVEEELRLALMAQKKVFHKKNSLKRKAESQENAVN
ncbi:hypothetical protein ACLKA7_011707 [Drosophila subpalustris]